MERKLRGIFVQFSGFEAPFTLKFYSKRYISVSKGGNDCEIIS